MSTFHLYLGLLNLNHVHLLLEARGYSASCLAFVKVTLQSEVSHICMFNRCLAVTVKTGNALLMIKEILCTTFILCIRRYISSSRPSLHLQEETVGLFLGHQEVRGLSMVRVHQNAALITEDMQNNTTCVMLITQVTLSAF